jgi:hypothetical protein
MKLGCQFTGAHFDWSVSCVHLIRLTSSGSANHPFMKRLLRYSRRQLWLCSTHQHVLIYRIAIYLLVFASIIAVTHWHWSSNHQPDVVHSEFRTFDDLEVEPRSAISPRIRICFITAHLPGSTQNSGMGSC